MQTAEKAGAVCADLVQPEVPKEVRYVWRWFCSISQGRHSTEYGLSPLAWAEIKAWAELTGRVLNEWEVATIRAIDWEYVNG